MLYRRNEKGRYEAVTDKGEIIEFEDEIEMRAFIEMRREVCYIMNKEPEAVEFSEECAAIFCPPPAPKAEPREKRVIFCIHEGEYILGGSEIKKALA